MGKLKKTDTVKETAEKKSLVKYFLTFTAIIGSLAGLIGYFSTISSIFVPSLSGCWDIVDEVKTKSSTPAHLTFRIFIEQDGRNFSAQGEKTHENNNYIPSSRHTRIEILNGSGKIGLQTATANFIEYGLKRNTSGTFRWNIERESFYSLTANYMTGTFFSSASNSSGESIAKRCKP